MKTWLKLLTVFSLLCAMTVSAQAESREPFVLSKTQKDALSGVFFFGESTTAHLARTGGILDTAEGRGKVLRDESGTRYLDMRILSSPVIYYGEGRPEQVSFAEAVERAQPRVLVLSFGLNGIMRWSRDPDAFLRNYRALDTHGKEMIDIIMEKELDRMNGEQRSATVLPAAGVRHRNLPLYDMPVSAGVGNFLDDDATEELRIKVTRTSAAASFALRISGNSMEPEFSDGDILLVREQDAVEQGELGIFVADGMGYFKRFMGDALRSLNPAYKDMPIKSFSSFRCCGKVIGRTRA